MSVSRQQLDVRQNNTIDIFFFHNKLEGTTNNNNNISKINVLLHSEITKSF